MTHLHTGYIGKYGLKTFSKWYERQPLPFIENEDIKRAWNMTIFTDKKLKHNRPDITLLQKKDKEWISKDIAVPAVHNIVEAQNEKVGTYQELALRRSKYTRLEK